MNLEEIRKLSNELLDAEVARYSHYRCKHCHREFGSSEWSGRCDTLLPSFSKDLNAMHEVIERVFKPGDYGIAFLQFMWALQEILGGMNLLRSKYNEGYIAWLLVTATARQRAEAFVLFREANPE